MRRFAVVLAAAFLAACQTPCPAPQSTATQKRFACADGSEISVRFTTAPETALVEQEGYTAISLPARIAGSGYRYVEGGAELRGRGMEVTWVRPGALETVCREIP